VVRRVGDVAGVTQCSSCSSWYISANITGKPRQLMPYIGGFPAYVEHCEVVAKAGYHGFAVVSLTSDRRSSSSR
jgi:cyclohexanone monooxygenase